MQEVASQGVLEEMALVQYVIDGIEDEETNKTILYSARCIRELKKNLEIYDRMRKKARQGTKSERKETMKDTRKQPQVAKKT